VAKPYRKRTVANGDRELLRACREGDANAWRNFLSKYERLVFSIPLNYGLSRDDAADVSQLTFTILIQSLDKLREDSHLGSWLATVARRHTWRLLERNRRERTDAHENLAEKASLLDESSADLAEHRELTEWFDYGLSRISARCRDLLLMLYFQQTQPSYAEIAARMGMPVGSIGPTRARCLEKLKRALDEK
jgi:RNA polymerase sigma factor (sigma-70 family)